MVTQTKQAGKVGGPHDAIVFASNGRETGLGYGYQIPARVGRERLRHENRYRQTPIAVGPLDLEMMQTDRAMKMKFIILLLLGIHSQSYCQKPFTATVPCSDSLLMTIEGEYRKNPDEIGSSISSVLPKAQQPEALRRMDAMHKLLLEAYPQPIGLDGLWGRTLTGGVFADDVKYSNGIPVCTYFYYTRFCSYGCVQNQPKAVQLACDVPNFFRVYVNQLGYLQNDYMLDTMSINGRKVYMLNPLIGSWKGYDLYGSPGENFGCVLLARRGESPFVPVTRKQYLDYCFPYLDRFFDKQISPLKQMPVRSLDEQEVLKKKSLVKIDEDYKNNPKVREAVKKNFLDTYKTDQQRRDETVNTVIRNKADVIKRYEAELEKTKAANLLDSPAEVFSPFTVSESTPIFATGPEYGKMLVTANRAYIRKDLPKYVPQFMVVNWKWVSNFPMYGGEQGVYYKKMIEANFPIEKLQAMIDK
jgi:hypothetical protein